MKPLPANPWTVAAYARWCETRHKYNTIIALMKAIAREHAVKSRKRPDRDPLVTKVLNTIEERQARRQLEKARQAALFHADDFTMKEPPPPAARKEKKAENPIGRVLRSSPKLVSRRPSLT